MSYDPSAGSTDSPKRSRLWLIAAAVLACVFFTLAALGARQAADSIRVLAQLDDAYSASFDASKQLYDWSIANAVPLAQGASAVSALVVVLALFGAGRRVGPVVLLGAGVCSAAWAQAMLLADRVELGIALYGTAFLCMLTLGFWKPLDRTLRVDPAPSSPIDWIAISLFTVFAMVTRLYGLNELPDGFDVEIISITLQSLTLHGIREWAGTGFFTNSAGIAHFVPQWAMAKLYGASLYSVRLAAASCGVLSVPIFYVLVRRLAGRSAAIFGTVLFVTSPEQLYWSRLETTVYVPLTVLSLTTVLLGFSLLRSGRWPVGLALAFCMGIARIFYHAGIVMFLQPVLFYAHALIFRPSARRLVLRVLPFVALGVVGWVLSISLMRMTARGDGFRFVNPFIISGQAPWTKQGQFTQQGPVELARLQAVSIGTNLGQLATSMSYSTGFSGWYKRSDASRHPTIINVAFFACLLLGLGYLLGQLQDLRAWAILTWIGLGLLPGVLSLDPGPRRVALIFPALPIVVTLFATSAVRLVRIHGSRLAGIVMAAAVATAAVGIGITNLVSHFLLPMNPLHLSKFVAAGRPVVEASDVVLYDLSNDAATTIVLGSLDVFSDRMPPPCTQQLRGDQPLAAVLAPTCGFDSFLHDYTISSDRLREARERYQPERITYVLSLAPRSQHMRDLLTDIYPGATRRLYKGPFEEFSFEAITVPRTQVEAAHKPRLRVAPGIPQPEQIFASTQPLDIVTDASVGEGAVVEAGFVLDKDEWWSLAVSSRCDSVIEVDGEVQESGRMRPLHAGPHAFSLRLPNPAACGRPLRVTATSPQNERRDVFASGVMVAPEVATNLRARALPVGVYPGYQPPERVVGPSADGQPVDFGVAPDGMLTVAFRNNDRVVLRRVRPDRSLDPTWRALLPDDFGFQSLQVARDGAIAVFGNAEVAIYDSNGQQTNSWPYPPAVLPGGAFDHDGAVLLSWPSESAVLRVRRDGTVEKPLRGFVGGPQRFDSPMTVVSDFAGDLVVMQDNGRVYRYSRPQPNAPLKLVTSFQTTAYGRLSGVEFGRNGMLFIPKPMDGTIEVYSPDGRRMLAPDPSHDLGEAVRFVRRFEDTGDRLYVLDDVGTLSAFKPVQPVDESGVRSEAAN